MLLALIYITKLANSSPQEMMKVSDGANFNHRQCRVAEHIKNNIINIFSL